jgi:hypothetical protein
MENAVERSRARRMGSIPADAAGILATHDLIVIGAASYMKPGPLRSFLSLRVMKADCGRDGFVIGDKRLEAGTVHFPSAGGLVLSRGVRKGELSPLLVVASASAQPAPGSFTRLEHALCPAG